MNCGSGWKSGMRQVEGEWQHISNRKCKVKLVNTQSHMKMPGAPQHIPLKAERRDAVRTGHSRESVVKARQS